MKVLGPDGNAAGLAATEVKDAHDPREVERHKNLLERLFTELMQEFIKEMTPDQEKPQFIILDALKIKDEKVKRWKEQLAVLNSSGFPHLADEELLGREIDSVIDEVQRKRDLQTPLCQLKDLAKYELQFVRSIYMGGLYLNSACAVAVHPSGLTRIWLRSPNEPLELWVEGWSPEPDRLPAMEQVSLTLQHLYNLVGACGITRVASLDMRLMAIAALEPKKPWYRFRS